MRWFGICAVAGLCAACGTSDTGSSIAVVEAKTAAPESSSRAAAPAASAPKRAPRKAAAPTVREVTLPAGTSLRLELTSSIASDSSEVEDTVHAELREAVVVSGRTVLPAGTQIVGTVTDVQRSGRVKGVARLAYRFDSLRHAGERYQIRTAPIAHEAEATKGEDATKIAVAAGAGAALGAVLGGGDGAAKGAAIGGAGGTGVVLATRGKEVRVGPGADVNTRLTAPLTLRVQL